SYGGSMTIDYSGINLSVEHILPELIVVVFAILVIFIDIFTRGRQGKNNLLAIVSIVGYVLAFVACVLYFDNNIGGSLFGGAAVFNTEAFNRMVVMDNLGLFFRMLSLGTAIVTVLLSTQYIKDRGLAVGEYYAVVGLATSGMMFTAAATDLTALFVGIELMSIAVY